MTDRRSFLKQAIASGVAAAFAASGCRRVLDRPTSVAAMAQTVLGPLDPSRLGFTLTHEHISATPDLFERWPTAWGGRDEIVARTVDHLISLRAMGVNSIVDLTPYDVGRDIRFLEEVSSKSGLNVIACTGQRFFPPNTNASMPGTTIAELGNFFEREIEEGIDGFSIKAGVTKIGIAAGQATELEEIGLRAAARTNRSTGAPVCIHANAAQQAGRTIAIILEEEDIDPARVSFHHSDDGDDMNYLLDLVRRGYLLSMDHVHRGLDPQFMPSFERRAQCIKMLVDAGFADKILVSQDSQIGGWLLPEETKTWREKSPWDPNEGLLFVALRLIPYLRNIGISDQAIHMITVENPGRFFSMS